MTRVIRQNRVIRTLRVDAPNKQATVLKEVSKKIVASSVPKFVDNTGHKFDEVNKKINELEIKIQEEENKLSVLDDPGDLALLFNSL